MGLRDVLYGVYAKRLAGSLDPRSDPAARRRDPRRQPALGQGVRRARPPTGHRARRRQDRRVPRLVRGGRCRGRHALAALDRTTSTARRTSSRRCCEIIEDVVTDLAATGRWRVHPMGALDLLPGETARLLKEVDERARRRRRAARQRRHRLRRPARDRRRGPLAAAGARRRGHDRSRTSRRSSTSSTSPSTSTPRASPTPTW